jgi:IS5 family transposase
MMVALLLYAYSRGVYSSRRIAQACEERVDFMAVTAMNRPDFRTIAKFRQRHLTALSDLFVQVLKLCRAAGLVKLGHVALDGTKVQANASVHKAMSYGRMLETENRLTAEVSAWFASAEARDAEEDRAHGSDRRGDEMPDWVVNKTARLERIRAAKATLEAEAKRPPPPQDDDGPGPSSGMMKSGKPDRGPDGGPPDRAQRNFTDPDSRIQPTRSGAVIAGYNAQIAVDGAHQIIVAQGLQTSPTDARALVPLIKGIRAVLRTNPKEVSADAGYCNENNLADLARRRIAGYLAPGRARHSQTNAAGPRRWPKGSRKAAMAIKLKRAGRRSRYRLRKQIVEPVFGQIKHARGFRQFLLRGLDKVRAEWAMICTVHNLLKLANATG